MKTPYSLAKIPESVIEPLKNVARQTGLSVSVLTQAALLQGLFATVKKEECHASVSNPDRPCHVLAPSGCPDSGVTEVPRPVMVQDEEPDLSL